MDMDVYTKLIDEATAVAGVFRLNGFELNSAGMVGAALLTGDGEVFTGINMDIVCGIGFCAEHAAIAQMLKARKTRISAIVSVRDGGQILPPCGRCRELMLEVDLANGDTEVIVADGDVRKLSELLPCNWNKIPL